VFGNFGMALSQILWLYAFIFSWIVNGRKAMAWKFEVVYFKGDETGS
jgi:hypothetical protein